MINVLLVTTDHIVYYRMYIYWNDVYCTRKNRHFNFINTGLEQWASVVVLLDSVALIDGRFCDLNLRFANAIVGVLPIAKTFFLEKLKSILIVVYSHRRKKNLRKKFVLIVDACNFWSNKPLIANIQWRIKKTMNFLKNKIQFSFWKWTAYCSGILAAFINNSKLQYNKLNLSNGSFLTNKLLKINTHSIISSENIQTFLHIINIFHHHQSWT